MNIPEGWKLVPVEPTDAMRKAGRGYLGSLTEYPIDVYDKMLAAAPTPSAQEAEPVTSLTISHFRGHLENRELDYYGDLPDGTHKLFTHPANDKLRKAAKELINAYNEALPFRPSNLHVLMENLDDALNEQPTKKEQ